jgi:AraC-like DNA-binding protein
MRRENLRITGLVQENTRYMRDQFLTILLSGDLGGDVYENIETLFLSLDINLPGPQYTVCCFCPEGSISPRARHEIIQLIDRNFVWHPGNVYPLNTGSLPYFRIIVSLAPWLPGNEPLENFANTFQRFLNDRGIEGTLFGGGLYDSVRDIGRSYVEALATREKYDGYPGKTFLYSGNSDGKSGGPGERVLKVKDYVDKNYSNSNLSLDLAAEDFGITPVYLSREFKKAFHMNFVDYVSFLRMNRAKHLLAETDIKIKDMVSEIGYVDAANFIRKFRIIEGITPGQYREKSRK